MQTAQSMRADLTCILFCRELDTVGCTVMVNYLIGGGMGYMLGQDALPSPLSFHSLPVIHPSLIMQGKLRSQHQIPLTRTAPSAQRSMLALCMQHCSPFKGLEPACLCCI